MIDPAWKQTVPFPSDQSTFRYEKDHPESRRRAQGPGEETRPGQEKARRPPRRRTLTLPPRSTSALATIFTSAEKGRPELGHGTPDGCRGHDLWTATLKGVTGPVTFKVLVNDLSWSAGTDYVVEAGQSVTITPTF